jgi:hypothetical protein
MCKRVGGYGLHGRKVCTITGKMLPTHTTRECD